MSNSSQPSFNINDFEYGMYLTNVNTQMTNIFLIVTSSIGIPGNLISMCVFARLIGKKSNMGLLYTWQSGVDLFLMIISLFFLRGSQMFFNGLVLNYSDGWCKSWSFWRRFALHIPSWIALLTTFDRYMFVFYGQQRFKFLRDKRIICLVILVMFLAIGILNYPNTYYYLVPIGNGISVCTSTFAILLSTDIISGLLRTYIPLIFMVMFNYRILLRLKESRRRSFNGRSIYRSGREKSFTKAVMFFDLLFFITKSPLTISLIVYDVYYFRGAFQKSFYSSSLSLLLSNLFINISYIDHTFSFFIYLAFNKLFRREFFRLISFGLSLSSSCLTNQRAALAT